MQQKNFVRWLKKKKSYSKVIIIINADVHCFEHICWCRPQLNYFIKGLFKKEQVM